MTKRAKLLLLILMPLSFVHAQLDDSLHIVFQKKLKIDKGELKARRIFYKKCPSVTTFDCYRSITILNNESLNLNNFIDDDDNFGKGLRYSIKDEEVLLLNAKSLSLGTTNVFWLKNFNINKLKSTKYTVNDEIKINDTLFYQDIQYKVSEILVYKIKVDFLNERLLSRNIGIISQSPYVNVYIIGGRRIKSIETLKDSKIINILETKKENKTSIHELEHTEELK